MPPELFSCFICQWGLSAHLIAVKIEIMSDAANLSLQIQNWLKEPFQ
jgi:hypothetical protein